MPRSILLIIGWLLPDSNASWLWVRPAALRAIANSWPNCSTTSTRVTYRGSKDRLTARLRLAYRSFATMRAVNVSRRTKAILAAVASAGWLLYMIVGLQVINVVAPTIGGSGPEGAAAFVGLVSGVFVCGLVMWAASD